MCPMHYQGESPPDTPGTPLNLDVFSLSLLRMVGKEMELVTFDGVILYLHVGIESWSPSHAIYLSNIARVRGVEAHVPNFPLHKIAPVKTKVRFDLQEKNSLVTTTNHYLGMSVSQAPLRGHVSQGDEWFLWWMYTLQFSLELVGGNLSGGVMWKDYFPSFPLAEQEVVGSNPETGKSFPIREASLHGH